MEDLFMFLPMIVIVVIGLIVTPLINMFKNTFGESTETKSNHRHASFGRQVDEMHVKDAGAERRHRLDQLKSLYDAGMMERDEYEERVACVEADYSQRRY